MIEVRLFAYLPGISRSKQKRVQVPYQEGLRVCDLLEMEGIAGEDLAIMVNGENSSPGASLKDGDSVFFLPAIAGGSGPRSLNEPRVVMQSCRRVDPRRGDS